jgi:dihydrofolate reductase
MKKLVSSILMTIDGYAANANGEMNMFPVDEKFFKLADDLIKQADTALYGRKTYDMMEAYWPTAADKPDASWHDKAHSAWYNKVDKFVVSKTIKDSKSKTTVIGNDVINEIKKLKESAGKNIQIFGSPSIVGLLMQENLIDEYWLLVAPVIIGNGISIFKDIKTRVNLKLIGTMTTDSGITGLHYQKIN